MLCRFSSLISCVVVLFVLFVIVCGSCLRASREIDMVECYDLSSPRHGRNAEHIPSLVLVVFIVTLNVGSNFWP